MVMRQSICFIFYILIIAGCEERVDIPLSSENTGLLVVEGVITNENKNHLVTLTLPYSRQNGDVQPVSGASVFIFQDSTGYVLTEIPAGSGRYYTPPLRGLVGKVYTLFIQHNGRQYFARDTPVPVQPLQEMGYRQTENGYTLTFNDAGVDPYYIEHAISWANSGFCQTGSSCQGRVMFYDLKTIDVNEIYKPEKEIFHFPENSLVIRRKFSVSPAYKAFLRSMLSETSWRGGVFDVERANVPTNLSAGAVGFFAVCSVVSDTTLVQ
jgi:hypothetical protein